MPVQLVLVEEPDVAELAEGMAAVRLVVGVAQATVGGQVAAVVHLALVREDLKMKDKRLNVSLMTFHLTCLTFDIFLPNQ